MLACQAYWKTVNYASYAPTSGPGGANDPRGGASMAVDFSLALSHIFLNELTREFRYIKLDKPLEWC
jgi:hypothetical protein